MSTVVRTKKILSHLSTKVNDVWQIRKKIKLKKKWRFWRSFRFYFLRKKFLSYFSKVKWFFNQNRIIWHYFKSLYGKKIKSLVFNKAYSKVAFGKPFIAIMACLELRLNILLVRMRFSTKQVESNTLISTGCILVNGSLKSKNYLVRVNDIIKKTSIVPLGYKLRSKLHVWRYKLKAWGWRKQKKLLNNKARQVGKKLRNAFWISKISLCVNYVEINYLIWTGLLLKLPTFGEILIARSKKYLSGVMLKKLYFLF